MNSALGDPRHKLLDVELIWTDAVERRQRSAEHVVARAHRAGALQRPEVGHILDNDQRGAIPAHIGTNGAGIGRVDIAAGRTNAHFLGRIGHGAGQRHQQLFLFLDHMKGGAPRGTRPQSRYLGQELDQALDFGAGDSL